MPSQELERPEACLKIVRHCSTYQKIWLSATTNWKRKLVSGIPTDVPLMVGSFLYGVLFFEHASFNYFYFKLFIRGTALLAFSILTAF